MALRVRFSGFLGRLRIMRGIFRLLERLNHWHATGFVIISFGLGQVLNRSTSMNNFFLYQILFIPAVIIAVAEIKRFVFSLRKYRIMTASHPNREVGSYISSLLLSNWAIPGLAVISYLYIYATITLEYVQLNSTGYYALIMISLVMFSAILGQTCYVYYLLFLRKLASSESMKYNFYFPARTDWVQLIAQIGSRLSNAFFVLGFIYTTVFFLNMPDEYVKISLSPWHVELSTPNDLVFLVSWLMIFAIIILAFPVYAGIKSRYIGVIIRKLKDTSVNEICMLMTASNIRDKEGIEAELKYYQLMSSIENSSSSPSERFNLLPIVATISSIAVHVIKISESLP